MIPKAMVFALAREELLRNTTIEKDYVLGWMLNGIAQDSQFSGWIFKGGTCLKKCFFETYRFSEDLDFTVQTTVTLDARTIETGLREVCCRSFRDDVSPERTREILEKKFDFKKLPAPSMERILARIDADSLRANWEQQLAHQLPALPPLDSFLSDLREALAWWMEPALPAREPLVPAEGVGETIGRQRFPVSSPRAAWGSGGQPASEPALDRVRFAARNRLCIELLYNGARRTAEPYSLRRSTQGNLLLYVHELTRSGRVTDQLKAYKVREMFEVAVTPQPFTPRWAVEL